MSQKQQKPTLSGQRIKTRKRGFYSFISQLFLRLLNVHEGMNNCMELNFDC